jgi:DNA-binding NarL/FixJ family response regulator
MITTNIVLADDHHIVRQGLRSLLESESDFKVVGEAPDGLEAVRLCEEKQPDVLVVDMVMKGMNGIEVTRQVAKSCPNTAIVVLSMYDNENYVVEALQSGAKAYVVKESTATELVRAIREARVGHRYLSPPLSERAINAYLQKSKATVFDPYETLTTREREVLHMAALGASSSEIATRLYVSRRTVENHRASMMRKLGMHTQTQLIRFAIQRGILPSDKP